MVPEMTSEKKDFDSVFKTKDVPLTLSNVHIVSHLSVRLFSVPPSPQFTERQKKLIHRLTGPYRTQGDL